jgi:hypothetical protein
MPEASVHEHGQAVLAEHDVGPDLEPRHLDLEIDAEAQPLGVEQATQP